MTSCTICNLVEGEIIWSDDKLRVVLIDDEGYRGYCRVEFINHIKENINNHIPLRLPESQIIELNDLGESLGIADRTGELDHIDRKSESYDTECRNDS